MHTLKNGAECASAYMNRQPFASACRVQVANGLHHQTCVVLRKPPSVRRLALFTIHKQSSQFQGQHVVLSTRSPVSHTSAGYVGVLLSQT
jgi:hypothetical protein